MNWTGLCSRAFNFLRLSVLSPSHLRKVGASRRVLKKLRGFASAGQDGHGSRIFGYLRKIDPYIFEELVLSALEDRGHFVLRNTRYSGDGGLDGKVRYQGLWRPIQCKRYSLHVNPRHLLDFEQELRFRNTTGLFVHCGKTGKASFQAMKKSRTRVISGEKLLQLLLEPRK